MEAVHDSERLNTPKLSVSIHLITTCFPQVSVQEHPHAQASPRETHPQFLLTPTFATK